MSNAIVPATYRAVIDDVIENIRRDFEETGISEEVLMALQRSWEHKVVASRVADFNVPAAGSMASFYATQQEYPAGIEIKQDESLDPVYGTADPYYGNDSANMPTLVHPNKPGLMLPDGGRSASNIPQNDGSSDVLDEERSKFYHNSSENMTRSEIDVFLERKLLEKRCPTTELSLQLESLSANSSSKFSRFAGSTPQTGMKGRIRRILQHDGPVADEEDDEDDEDVSEDEDDATPNGHTSLSRRKGASGRPETKNEDIDGGAGSDVINSDLDDTDDDENDVEGGSDNVDNIVLCLYDKVTRTKNKWKCVLKDGVVLINGKDFLFQKASGDFEW